MSGLREAGTKYGIVLFPGWERPRTTKAPCENKSIRAHVRINRLSLVDLHPFSSGTDMRLLSAPGLIVIFALTGLLLVGCDLSPSGSSKEYRATASAVPSMFGSVRPTDTTVFGGVEVIFRAEAVKDTGPNSGHWRGALLRWKGLQIDRNPLKIVVRGDTSLTALFAGRTWVGFRISDVANNGAVAGESLKLAREPRGLRWIPGGGSTLLGTLGGESSQPTVISTDGTVIVGQSTTSEGNERAFRWEEGSGMRGLGTLGGAQSEALGVSHGGSVVVGWAENSKGAQRAFRWTEENGMERLGTLGGNSSVAAGVSGDGTVVAGHSATAAGEERVFRWTPEGGMEDLGNLGGPSVTVHAVSADGSTIVGAGQNSQGNLRGFRWTRESGMVSLGALGEPQSRALDVSADGAVVVGDLRSSGARSGAFRWTPENGMEDLNEVYAALLEDPQEMWEAMISPNGQFVVGQGRKLGIGIHSYLVDRGLPR